jgi:hypothetical protein
MQTTKPIEHKKQVITATRMGAKMLYVARYGAIASPLLPSRVMAIQWLLKQSEVTTTINSGRAS